ncbi:hypothetical protein [Streptomyces sp. NPDC059874]|uniref:hypothetical protein n=1 Tax=Streptomyces sp. NPDC059874 TaxID=3346983 RepID=UPI00365BB750
MASTRAKAFSRGVAPTAQTTVYTVPAEGQAIVTNIVCTNTTSAAIGITVKLDSFSILSSVGVAPHGVVALDITQPIEAGDTIQVQASADNLVVHISGVEVS